MRQLPVRIRRRVGIEIPLFFIVNLISSPFGTRRGPLDCDSLRIDGATIGGIFRIAAIFTRKFGRLIVGEEDLIIQAIRSSGGIGRRAGFRFPFRKECRFDSCLEHRGGVLEGRKEEILIIFLIHLRG